MSARPPSVIGDTGDSAPGYADTTEILAFLDSLLQAARAGARAAHASARAPGFAKYATLLRIIESDGARWCGLLRRHCMALGVKPAHIVGAVYDKAMAIAAPDERLRYITRSQDWVVKQLRTMLPRLRDDRLHSDLSRMLRSLEGKIALVERLA